MRKRILVVDDSATALMMERTLLGKSSYDVVVAKDGEEAVKLAVEQSPDLILMDVVMPKMDGFEACRKLRSGDSTKAIPIILVTTRGEEQNVRVGYESGCSDYVTKPIDGPALLAKMKLLLGA